MTERAYPNILQALRDHGLAVKEYGATARCACPAHGGDQRDKNLSIFDTADRVNLKCHSHGCEPAAILKAVGLTVADRYDHDKRGEVSYDYLTVDGRRARTVHRKVGEKRFWQKIPDEEKGQPTPLYRLPQVAETVAAGRTVYLVEGEEDVHALEAVGQVATTAPQGASNFAQADVKPLTGAHVVAVVDRDQAGAKWAEQVAAKLAHVAASVEFRQAHDGKDISDHLTAGLTLDQLDPYQPPEDTGIGDVPGSSTMAPRVVDHLITEFPAERPTFAWLDRWLTNSLAIVSGRGGAGKSTYVLDKLAKATKGELPGEYEGRPVHVGLVGNLEDGAGPARLRLQAAGADADLVHVPEFFGDDGQPEPFHMGRLSTLQGYIEAHHLKIVMIDLINNLIHDDRKASDVRKVFPPLNQVAYATNCAIIGINHFRKSGGLGSDLMAGSAALRDNTRSLILMAASDEGNRIATLDKLNLSTHQGESWEFTLQSVTIPDDNKQPTEIATVVELGESSTSVQEVVNRKIAEAAGQDDGDQDDCASWLRSWADSEGGQLDAGDVRKAVETAGFSWSAAKRARVKLEMTTRRDGFGKGSRNIWTLPVDGSDPHRAHIGLIGTALQDVSPMSPMAGSMVTDLRTRQELGTCSECGQPMTVTYEGQTCHPDCEPSGGAA